MKTHSTKSSGFTLVELAIVLVIIGLIIGGVLVGQDLIKAAGIRSAVTDIEKFNAGATAFQGKYTGLPGDLSNTKAAEFGISVSAESTTSATGAAGLRDGNGVIEGGASGAKVLAGETALFWRDLGNTGLIAGTFTGIGTAATPGAISSANVGTFLPHSKLRESASYHAYSVSGRNYYYIGTLTQTASAGAITEAAALTPLEARGIDEKIDDAAPATGVVIAMANMVADPGIASPTASSCLNSLATAASLYNVSTATGGGTGVNCQLQIRTSF